MKFKILAIVFTGFLVGSCNNNSTKEKDSVVANDNKEAVTTSKEQTEAYTLFKNNCYACHSVITKSHNDIIAPPMVAVKNRYQKSFPTKEAFVKAVTTWVLDPKEENALMLGAVSQFKVMPKQPFKEEDVVKIAEYIYDNEIEQPEWFAKHFNTMHPNGMGGGMGKNRKMNQ